MYIINIIEILIIEFNWILIHKIQSKIPSANPVKNKMVPFMKITSIEILIKKIDYNYQDI